MLLHARPNTENTFPVYFLEPKTNIWKYFPFRKILSTEIILHSKNNLHLTKPSLKSKFLEESTNNICLFESKLICQKISLAPSLQDYFWSSYSFRSNMLFHFFWNNTNVINYFITFLQIINMVNFYQFLSMPITNITFFFFFLFFFFYQ